MVDSNSNSFKSNFIALLAWEKWRYACIDFMAATPKLFDKTFDNMASKNELLILTMFFARRLYTKFMLN